jgi:serine/threonine-protein kinase RIO1
VCTLRSCLKLTALLTLLRNAVYYTHTLLTYTTQLVMEFLGVAGWPAPQLREVELDAEK